MPEEIKNDMIEEKNFTKLLRVNFTSKEKLDTGEQMANAVRNIKQAQDDLASVQSQFKSDIKKYEAELSGLAEKLNSGWEMRSVTCVQIKDFNVKSVQIKRLDTLEVIEERAMDADELQMGLFENKESPTGEGEAKAEPVEGAEAITEPPNQEDLLDRDKDDPFYADRKGKEVEDAT